jgi:hypothetical protein
MQRIVVSACAAVAALMAWGAGAAPAIVAPIPAAGTFSGSITSASGRYAGAHGHVTIRDASLVSQGSSRLDITGRACHGARHCLAVNGQPSASLTLKGHPIPDAGYTFTIRGAGRVAPLGHVTVSGLLQVPGFVACGHQTMTFTLIGSRGRVKVTAETPPRCVGGPPD